jgi:putative tRNA adenosine deaminase-associated protein
MAEDDDDLSGGIDMALVAYREEGVWLVTPVAEETAERLDDFVAEMRRWPGDFGSLGMISVDEDFFVLVRVAGSQVRVLLSDVTAATEWPIARDVVDLLDLPLPDEEDDQVPAGDLAIVSEFGFDTMAMGALLEDYELYPDEMLGDIARKLGFGSLYDDLAGVATP